MERALYDKLVAWKKNCLEPARKQIGEYIKEINGNLEKLSGWKKSDSVLRRTKDGMAGRMIEQSLERIDDFCRLSLVYLGILQTQQAQIKEDLKMVVSQTNLNLSYDERKQMENLNKKEEKACVLWKEGIRSSCFARAISVVRIKKAEILRQIEVSPERAEMLEKHIDKRSIELNQISDKAGLRMQEYKESFEKFSVSHNAIVNEVAGEGKS